MRFAPAMPCWGKPTPGGWWQIHPPFSAAFRFLGNVKTATVERWWRPRWCGGLQRYALRGDAPSSPWPPKRCRNGVGASLRGGFRRRGRAPLRGVAADVGSDAFEVGRLAEDLVVEPGLPVEIGSIQFPPDPFC